MPILCIGRCQAGSTFGTGLGFGMASADVSFCKEEARALDDDAEDPCKGGACEAALLGPTGEVLFAAVAAEASAVSEVSPEGTVGVAWMGNKQIHASCQTKPFARLVKK